MRTSSSASDRITAVAVLVFSGVFAWQTAKLQNRLDVIFPRFLLVGLVILALLLLALSFTRHAPKASSEEKREDHRGRAWGGVVGTLLWVVLIPITGFALTSVVALTGLTLLLGEKTDRSPSKAISAALVSTVIVTIIYFAFSHYLEVPLPRGRILPS
jgi:Mn2+/Fe2+ NRAMP family transporter